MTDPLYLLGPQTHTHCSVCSTALLNRSTLVPLCSECRLIITNGDDPHEGLGMAKQ